MDDTLLRELTHAIESGYFERANILIESYGRAVGREFHTCADRDGRAAVVNEALAFLHDRLHLARVMRAHMASQVKAATGASLYCRRASIENTWQMDG